MDVNEILAAVTLVTLLLGDVTLRIREHELSRQNSEDTRLVAQLLYRVVITLSEIDATYDYPVIKDQLEQRFRLHR